MKNALIERVILIIEYHKLSVKKFAEMIGMPQTTVNGYVSGSREPKMDFAAQIVSRFENISSEWLLTGNGEMLKSPIPSSGDSVIAGRDAIGNNSNITGGIQGHSVKNGNITGDYNNVGIMPSDCERSLIKAKAEIDVLKKKLKESEAKIKDIEARCKEEKEILNKMLDQAVLDKERAMNMLEKALDK